MALHEQSVGATDEWYTPRHVFQAMGVRFDLDVASPGREVVSWVPADRHVIADSLSEPWRGFVWMNPPFGGRNGLVPWLDKFFAHGNGVALVPDRTSAPWWQDYAQRADALLFVRSKLKFLRPDGSEGSSPAQGTTLLAAGDQGVLALVTAAQAGLGLLSCPSKALGLGDRMGRVPCRLRETRAAPSSTSTQELPMAFDATDFIPAKVDPLTITDPRERLKYLAGFLRDLPDERFDIGDVFSRGGRYVFFPQEGLSAFADDCGTAACICGWAGIVFRPEYPDSWDVPEARQLLDLPHPTARALFMPSGWMDGSFKPTPRQAAQVIDHLLLTGEVDWSVAGVAS